VPSVVCCGICNKALEKHVCVQLPASTDSMTLLAFAAELRAAAALGGCRYRPVQPDG